MLKQLEEIYSILRETDIILHENVEKIEKETKRKINEKLKEILKTIKSEKLEINKLKKQVLDIYEIIKKYKTDFNEKQSKEKRTQILKGLAAKLEYLKDEEKIIEIKNKLETLTKALILTTEERGE